MLCMILTGLCLQAPRLSSEVCASEWSSFYEDEPNIYLYDNMKTPASIYLTLLAISMDGYYQIQDDEQLRDVFDDIEDSPSGVVAFAMYHILAGNRSIEELATQGAVEPVLTTFTKSSIPMEFARLKNGTYTVTDAVHRTFTVRDTKKSPCNTRVLVIDSFLLPAYKVSLFPQITLNMLTDIALFFEFGYTPATAPAPAPLASLSAVSLSSFP